MKIEILGAGCAKCKTLYENTRKAIEELELDATIQKVEDLNKITDYGVLMTPALVVDGEVKSSGKALTPEQVKKLITGS